MLTPIDDAQPVSGATVVASAPDKTVAIMHYGSSNTLLYTVPAGRTWVGCFWGTNAVEGYVVPSGSTFTSGQNNSNSIQSMWPPYIGSTTGSTADAVLTLQAGDMLYSGTSTNYRVRIVGVESDV
tara:strand:+ start:78 stop:452 length:375 start_codon:yes stop_codon:yes gene_type:complete